MSSPKPKPFRCFNCGLPVGDENMCRGCETAVCGDCDINMGLMGPHMNEDHLVESSE